MTTKLEAMVDVETTQAEDAATTPEDVATIRDVVAVAMVEAVAATARSSASSVVRIIGHKSYECPNQGSGGGGHNYYGSNRNNDIYDSNQYCFNCGDPNHVAPQCPNRASGPHELPTQVMQQVSNMSNGNNEAANAAAEEMAVLAFECNVVLTVQYEEDTAAIPMFISEEDDYVPRFWDTWKSVDITDAYHCVELKDEVYDEDHGDEATPAWVDTCYMCNGDSHSTMKCPSLTGRPINIFIDEDWAHASDDSLPPLEAQGEDVYAPPLMMCDFLDDPKGDDDTSSDGDSMPGFTERNDNVSDSSDDDTAADTVDETTDEDDEAIKRDNEAIMAGEVEEDEVEILTINVDDMKVSGNEPSAGFCDPPYPITGEEATCDNMKPWYRLWSNHKEITKDHNTYKANCNNEWIASFLDADEADFMTQEVFVHWYQENKAACRHCGGWGPDGLICHTCGDYSNYY